MLYNVDEPQLFWSEYFHKEYEVKDFNLFFFFLWNQNSKLTHKCNILLDVLLYYMIQLEHHQHFYIHQLIHMFLLHYLFPGMEYLRIVQLYKMETLWVEDFLVFRFCFWFYLLCFHSKFDLITMTFHQHMLFEIILNVKKKIFTLKFIMTYTLLVAFDLKSLIHSMNQLNVSSKYSRRTTTK